MEIPRCLPAAELKPSNWYEEDEHGQKHGQKFPRPSHLHALNLNGGDRAVLNLAHAQILIKIGPGGLGSESPVPEKAPGGRGS